MACCARHRESEAGKGWLKHSPRAEETKDRRPAQKGSGEAPAAANNYKVNREGAHAHLLGRCMQNATLQRTTKTLMASEPAQ